jgi:hypothetical protein
MDDAVDLNRPHFKGALLLGVQFGLHLTTFT